ncbi:MAG: hypothetical protein F6J90_12305 [Moorea sp. SIOASIH]|uniref:hypothetical protein n=1 Tax=Moorena sp. SIOASIH TaxID=2607817 RepID=UPI0013B891FE|nr:hypothetical protein [Moorena sp. SIOASIH]NEO37048.1 hypothetical protein [Moorena sp. SIOASIH]
MAILVEQASCLWCHGHLGGTGILPVVESAPLQKSDPPVPDSRFPIPDSRFPVP